MSHRFHKAEGQLVPEIHSVAEFMAAQLGDCSGDKDRTFMTLRVQRVINNEIHSFFYIFIVMIFIIINIIIQNSSV